MDAVEQLELFPSATDKDAEATIKLLREDYPQWKASKSVFETMRVLTPEQKGKYDAYNEKISVVDMAIRTIKDDEARRIIEHRFIKGGKWKHTVINFRSVMSERTVDRRITEGIRCVANTLKDCGII
ncbi:MULTISPECIES: hypothetical protein [unclassified Paenibacillus]|uniref:hypothetical protein n=1 Tax=unclassified Paenibacillus TaxID=185978 RepID=UPI0009A6E9B1|nr:MULTISPECIES: hypothetical protein [unclassified Paenibacillus]SLJ92740.1 hypothetical protein SAMN06272722_1011131 [Paenibacillus sp. RU5A]SOC58517.1 hypothetical protein SAMN05880581_10159 [Paenibacillus sp. RU26A]SOC67569.1 hypothetical protein SAMN05880586_10159 [Paenibacillus sp. RU5M]